MRRWIIFALAGSGCLFNGAETEGLPCNTNDDCANGNDCIEQVCGGPVLAGTSESGSDESDSSGDDESSTPSDDDMDGARDECVPTDTRCIDDDTVSLCTDDGKLQTVGCPGLCGEATPALGCHDASEGEQCYCAFERETCASEGALDCASNNQLTICEGGWWELHDCDAICSEAGYQGTDGCGPGESNDVCFCNESCIEASQRCVNDDEIAGCWGGTWYPESCAQICADNGYVGTLGCLVFPNDDSGCSCLE
jgi:hypothetical protein